MIEPVILDDCIINLGELHRLEDPGFYSPEFVCRTMSGTRFTLKLRLPITASLDPLIAPYPGEEASGRQVKITSEQIVHVLSTRTVCGPGPHPRRIAMTCHDPQQVGGGNSVLFRYANWLAQLGIEVSIYSCARPPAWMRVDARFVTAGSYAEMAERIEEETVLVYSIWHIEPLLRHVRQPKRLIGLRQGAETFHYATDLATMLAPKPILDVLERVTSATIVVSPALRQWYGRRFGIHAEVVPNAIDHRSFRPAAVPAGNLTRILSVGDPAHFLKGARYLADALTTLALKRPEQSWTWRVIGGDPKGPPVPGWDPPPNLTCERFSGQSPAQMCEHYHASGIFVNASLYEGFGLPTVEAMACGVPVVQANHGGLDDIVADGLDCIVVPRGNSKAITAAIERLVDSPDLRQALVAGGAETAGTLTEAAQFHAFMEACRDALGCAFDPRAKAKIAGALSSAHRAGERPLVSVVVPSFNQADYLGAALDSLIAQSYDRWEAIVVNDGSTDETPRVLADYSARDPRIRAVTTANQGIAAALNEGLARAEGEFFCWLSSDDLFYPDKLRVQVEALRSVGPDIALSYGSFDLLDEASGAITELPMQQPLMPGAELAEALRFDYIDGCTVMIRMDAIRTVGGFNPGFRHSQDLELWMRLAARGYRFELAPHKLTIRRVHARQSSTSNMIHCRYDAAALVDRYLDKFSLWDVYRYVDPTDPRQLSAMIRHLISRVDHAEANVNHPLVRQKFWSWVEKGLAVLPPDEALAARDLCCIQLMEQRAAAPVCNEYLERILRTPAGVEGGVHVVDGRPRDVVSAGRGDAPFMHALFEYAKRLLVDDAAPRFGQELTFHGVNEIVGTRQALAHSALRYIAQHEGPLQAAAAAAAQRPVPATAEDGIRLFAGLACPSCAAAIDVSLRDAAGESIREEDVTAAEARLAAMPEAERAALRAACALPPSEPLLHYWNALTLAEVGQREAAAAEAARTRSPRCNRYAPRVAAKIRAWSAETPAPALEPAGQDEPQAIEDAAIHVFADGTYSLDLTAATASGVRFRTTVRQPFAAPLDGVVLQAPTGDAITLTQTALVRAWSAGVHPRSARTAAPDGRLAVAFTLLNGASPGGGPSVVLRYANWLHDLGVDVSIYSNDALPPGAELRATYHQVADDEQRYAAITEPIVVLYSIVEWPALHRARRDRLPVVFHLCQGVEDHNYHDGSFADLCARKPVFEALHAVPLRRIVVSPALERYFAGRDGESPLVVPNGTDLRVFRPDGPRSGPAQGIPAAEQSASSSTASPARTGNPGLRVIAVGAPERPIKGAADVVAALETIAAARPDLPVTLRILGGRGPAPASARIAVEHHVAASAEAMADEYRGADLVVNAAWYEGYGLPSIEAMACGVLVVQADNQGLDGVVCDGVDCLVVPPHDPDALAGAITRLIGSPSLRRAVVEGGLETARRCSMSAQFEAFVTVFERVLQCEFDRADVARLRKAASVDTLDQRLAHWREAHQPFFSVLLPAYNHAQFLPAAIDSLLAQTYGRWEAVVVDDGSTDDTPEVLERYARIDSRIRPLRQQNAGVAAALNLALRHARGSWICWLSADDLFEATKLDAHRRASLRKPQAAAFYSGFSLLDDSTGISQPADAWQPDPDAAFQVSRFLRGPYIHGNTVAIRREVFAETGVFNEASAWAQDFDMWLRIAARHAWEPMAERTCVTRCHDGQGTRRFPEALGYDGAWACGVFLNRHPFAEMYPFMDLASPPDALRAVRDALALVASPGALVHRAGYNRALLARVIEWYALAASAGVRGIIRPELEVFLVRTQGRLDASCRDLLAGALGDGLRDWRFEPTDLDAMVAAHGRRLAHAGDHVEADAVARYLASRPASSRQSDAHLPDTQRPVRAARVGATETRVAHASHAATALAEAAPVPRAESAFHLDHVRRVAIFGAGRYGRLAAELAQRCGWQVECYVDNNHRLWGTDIAGVPVREPRTLAARSVDLVIVASHAHLALLARQLDEMGLVHGCDYIGFLAPIQVGSVALRLSL